VSKWEEVTREKRKLTNEQLYDLHSCPNIVCVIKIKNNQMGGVCSTHEEKRGECRVLLGKSGGERLF
jgi:hypothetical protein